MKEIKITKTEVELFERFTATEVEIMTLLNALGKEKNEAWKKIKNKYCKGMVFDNASIDRETGMLKLMWESDNE